MKSNINLHIHTIHSDGAKSVVEIIEGLKAVGVDTFAITDHDCIKGNNEIMLNHCNLIPCAGRTSLKQIYGIELSCCFDGEIGLDETYTAHILGYDINIDIMEQALLELKERKEISLRELYDELRKNGYKLPPLKVDDLKRTYIAKLLVKAGYFANNNESFEKCLNTDAYKRFARNTPTIREGIALLKEKSEGVAVWAHPFGITRGGKKDLTEKQVLELAKKMVEYGIEGIEVYYQNYTVKEIRFLEKLADKYKLVKSIGTDYHSMPENTKDEPEYAKRLKEQLYFDAEGITPDVTILDYINKKQEIQKVIELTGATKDQIKLHNDGYWSRAYVVSGGDFVVKFPKYDSVDYTNEAKFLDFINSHNPPISMQKVKWLAKDNRLIAFYGVKGTPLSELKSLSVEQKSDITKQLANFLKQLHPLQLDNIGVRNLRDEIENYKERYKKCSDFFNKHLNKNEKETLDILIQSYLSNERLKLGEKLILCHGDVWDPNILVDESGKVGIIDCANAGYYEQATDFCFYDESLRKLLLNHYGADEELRKKVELKYAMSVIVSPMYIIKLEDEDATVKKYLPLIREIIAKYKDFL